MSIHKIGGGVLNRDPDAMTLRDYGNMERCLPFWSDGKLVTTRKLNSDWFETQWKKDHCRERLRRHHSAPVSIGRLQRFTSIPCAKGFKGNVSTQMYTVTKLKQTEDLKSIFTPTVVRRSGKARLYDFDESKAETSLLFAANPKLKPVWLSKLAVVRGMFLFINFFGAHDVRYDKGYIVAEGSVHIENATDKDKDEDDAADKDEEMKSQSHLFNLPVSADKDMPDVDMTATTTEKTTDSTSVNIDDTRSGKRLSMDFADLENAEDDGTDIYDIDI